MKLLSVVVATIAAFAAAQDTALRGGFKQMKGKTGTCTLDQVPQELQTTYEQEFKALDVDNSGAIDPSEFTDAGVKIADMFQTFRTAHGRGGKGSGKGPGGPRGSGSGKPNKGPRGSGKGPKGPRGSGKGPRGPRGSGSGQGRPGGKGSGTLDFGGSNTDWGTITNVPMKLQSGVRRLAAAAGDFWNYLTQNGFNITPEMQDKIDSLRAAKVFSKFDKDGNKQVSLCEFETAMYRMAEMEKKADANTVVVQG